METRRRRRRKTETEANTPKTSSLGKDRGHADAHFLRKAAHHIHVLHCLPTGPLHQVVNHADDDGPSR
eukprot:scaffold8431_cov248-Pinguiococcus_pyrenoidosus.AAC.2